jgi:hypothetical protein
LELLQFDLIISRLPWIASSQAPRNDGYFGVVVIGVVVSRPESFILITEIK